MTKQTTVDAKALESKIRAIVDDALNSAIPEPWEVADHATKRILTALSEQPAPDHAGLDWLKIEKLAGKYGIRWCNEHDLHDEAIAALSRAPEAVAVKPLEWRKSGGGWESKGHGIIEYEINAFDVLFIGGQQTERFWGDTQKAKAAAQADYERRILSALATPPAPQGAVANYYENSKPGEAWNAAYRVPKGGAEK